MLAASRARVLRSLAAVVLGIGAVLIMCASPLQGDMVYPPIIRFLAALLLVSIALLVFLWELWTVWIVIVILPVLWIASMFFSSGAFVDAVHPTQQVRVVDVPVGFEESNLYLAEGGRFFGRMCLVARLGETEQEVGYSVVWKNEQFVLIVGEKREIPLPVKCPDD